MVGIDLAKPYFGIWQLVSQDLWLIVCHVEQNTKYELDITILISGQSIHSVWWRTVVFIQY